ncbi:MAG: hypothetical protein HQK91_03115 [Nitrospirae bacterium]|nr:hypothetical protein [Nitrospirota bacterium]
MNILLIFASNLCPNQINISEFSANDTIYLFPLTSNNDITLNIISRLKDFKTEIINTTILINETSDLVSSQYIKFIGELPLKIKSKNLLEWFKLNDNTSLWWFSKVCEKGTFDTDTFNSLVQFDTIINFIRTFDINKILYGTLNHKIKISLIKYCEDNHISFEISKTKDTNPLKTRFLKSQRFLFIKHIILMIYCMRNIFIRSQQIKKTVKDLNRKKAKENSFLIVTPFPSLDLKSANQGIYKNKFFGNIHEAIEEKGIDIIWCAMQIIHHNMTFKNSLEIGLKLIKGGNIIYFLEEFSTIILQIKAFIRTIINGLKFLLIQDEIKKAHNINGYNFYGILRDDFYSSFIGGNCYQGILFYDLFCRLFLKVGTQKGLYIFEQNMWEKIMISASNRDAKTKMYGYLQGTISPMQLKYFNHPNEITYNGKYSMPKPYMIICDGAHPARLLSNCGWPDSVVKVAEATRYNYLKEYLHIPINSKDNVILIALSIGILENAAIVETAYLAFKDKPEIEIRLKPHPFTDLEAVLKLAGISKEDLTFKIIGGGIADALRDAKILIAGETGVAVESLAFGCRVVLINNPQWINLSSLRGIDSPLIKTVNSSEELYTVVKDCLVEDCNLERDKFEANRILGDFFYLDNASDYPKKFIELLDL